MKLLDYVAIYGLVLMPIGAIVLAEHWLFPKLGIRQYRAERNGLAFNMNALFSLVRNARLLLRAADPPVL